MEGVLLKAAWNWGRNCNVVNNPVGEPGCTPLYVGLLSMRGSEYSEQTFCPFSREGFLIGDSMDMNE